MRPSGRLFGPSPLPRGGARLGDKLLGLGAWVFKVQGSGFRVQGFRVQGLGFRV